MHVDQAETIGPDYPDAVLARSSKHLRLALFPFLAHLPEAAADDHDETHAVCAALVDRLRHQRGRQGDDRDIARFRHVLDRGITAQTRHLPVLWIDRVDAALEPVVLQRPDGLRTGTIGLGARAYDCDRAWIKKIFKGTQLACLNVMTGACAVAGYWSLILGSRFSRHASWLSFLSSVPSSVVNR